jgi:2-hydroxychromene-2-carboxylate isomerase
LVETVFNETSTYRVWLGVFPENIWAHRAYRAAGFREEGIARGSAFFGEVHGNELIMSLLRPEWNARREAINGMPRLQFWYDLASTYSYLSAMRIADLAKATGVEIVWQPFLLGPVFKAQGWDTSPFNLYPAKGRHMIRDMQRISHARGLPFVMPEPFPQNSLLATRIAFLGEPEGWAAPFTKAVYRAAFGQGADISTTSTLVRILGKLGIEAARATFEASELRIKNGLKQRTAEARRLGIFGAPSFVTDDGELFWGDDRLEQALAWANIKRHSTR